MTSSAIINRLQGSDGGGLTTAVYDTLAREATLFFTMQSFFVCLLMSAVSISTSILFDESGRQWYGNNCISAMVIYCTVFMVFRDVFDEKRILKPCSLSQRRNSNHEGKNEMRLLKN